MSTLSKVVNRGEQNVIVQVSNDLQESLFITFAGKTVHSEASEQLSAHGSQCFKILVKL